MPVPISPVVREILKSDLDQPADDVIRKAKAKGVTAPVSSIRDAVHNIKSELRRAKGGAKPKPAPAAAQATKPMPVPAPAVELVAASVSAPVSSSVPDLSAVLANVALVNTVVGACGSVETARKVAEAVRACGSVDAFLQHLDLVAQVRGATTTSLLSH